MRIRCWLNKALGDRKGNAAIEMALLFPILLSILAGVTELGRAFFQASALERGLRAAASYAARAELPLSADVEASAENLAMTASMDGVMALTADNWNEAGADFDIQVTQRDVGSVSVPVLLLQARVPFSPVSDELWDILNLPQQFIQVNHEQAYIGI